MIDTALRNRFMALRLGAPDQPSPSAESITHAAILDSLLIWPLDEASDAPWPLMWAGEGDQRVPRIELAQADIALFGSQAYKWEFGVTCAFPIEALALYGPEATLELPQKTTFDHHLAFAQALIGVVHFYAEQLGVPERPGDAFQYLHFGINRRAEQQLLGEFPATRFLIRPDRKAYGLLLEAADGRRHFIYRDTEGPSGLTRLGVGRGDQESIAQLMPEFQHWERIEDLSTPRVDLAIPVRSQESTE